MEDDQGGTLGLAARQVVRRLEHCLQQVGAAFGEAGERPGSLGQPRSVLRERDDRPPLVTEREQAHVVTRHRLHEYRERLADVAEVAGRHHALIDEDGQIEWHRSRLDA